MSKNFFVDPNNPAHRWDNHDPHLRGKPIQYPFHLLEVGDSFTMPRDLGMNKRGCDIRQTRISALALMYRKLYNPNAKFRVNLTSKTEVTCTRTS